MITKKFIKYLIITAFVAGMIIAFTSCKKHDMAECETEHKGVTYFRVEGVDKSGKTDYSNVETVEIK
jgi:hypothetical protein